MTENIGMELTLRPTDEWYDAPVNGVMVRTRIWVGITNGGIPVETYILATIPRKAQDRDKFARQWAAAGLVKARDVNTINYQKEKTK